MKKISLLAIGLIFAATTSAFACATPAPTPNPTQTQTQTQSQGQGQTQTMSPTLNVTGGNPTANAIGGNATGGKADANSASFSNSAANSSSKSDSNSAAVAGVNASFNVKSGDSTSTSSLNVAKGAVQSSSSTGPVTNTDTNTNTNTVGPVSANNQGNNQLTDVHVEASKMPPAPEIPVISGTDPLLLSQTASTNEKGAYLTLKFNKACKSKAMKDYDTATRTYTGISGNTNVTWVPNIAYAMASKKSQVEVQEGVAVFDEPGYYKCLGVVTIVAKPAEADVTPVSAIVSDAENFPIEHLKGFAQVTMLSSEAILAHTNGVSNRGGGFGVGAGGAQLFSNLLATVGVSASKQSGDTFGVTKEGTTFFALVKTVRDDPMAVYIDLAPPPAPAVKSKAKGDAMTTVRSSCKNCSIETKITPKASAAAQAATLAQ